MAFEVKAGYNYLTRKSFADLYTSNAPCKSADVLKVGNGFVVFQVCNEDVATGKFKIATLSGFQKSYTDGEVSDELIGKKHNKRVVLDKCPEAAAAWE